ncbi:MAG TPA: hypothetical protein VKQ30_23335, partial [Ktedonobacterales bacterium]|nr:hypothetical protein [Ktedonobacterales bacterium]
MCVWLLVRLRAVLGGSQQFRRQGVAVVAASVTGLPALLLPQSVGHLLGYKVTDVIVLTLAGAATCGYAV